jgi:hypothetical protein
MNSGSSAYKNRDHVAKKIGVTYEMRIGDKPQHFRFPINLQFMPHPISSLCPSNRQNPHNLDSAKIFQHFTPINCKKC